MNHLIRSTGTVLLLLAAGNASGGIGIFSEPNGSNCNLTLPNLVATPIYVLYMDQGGPQATGAEYRIGGMPGVLGQDFTATLVEASGSNLNLGNSFEAAHNVAWPTPQPFDANGNLLLATWIVTTMGTPVPPGTILTVSGGYPYVEGPCLGSPLITDGDFALICQEGAEMRVNGGPPCTVVVEDLTWTGVRNLYR